MGLTPSKISQRPSAPCKPLSLSHLGDELFCNLCHELEVSSLGSLACSSRHFRAQLCNEDAWRQALCAFGAANVQQLRGMLTLSAPRWRSLHGGDKQPRARDHHIAFGASAGLIIFGGNDFTRGHMMSDAWLLDVKTHQWHLVATEGCKRPSPRTFNADGGGGGILRDQKSQREWMVIYGGLRGEGYRDNETWLLGPLESDCALWRWQEIEEGGGPQSRLRPTPRFHHTQTGLGDSTLAVLGGHDFMIRPILAAGLLKLHEVKPEGEDEIEWELLSDSQDGPVPRAYHSAVHWRKTGALVLFGGVTRPGTARSQFGLQVHRDTWILDADTWRPTWSRLPAEFIGTLDGGRCHATASILKDRFLAIAGGCERVAGLQGDDGWIMAGLQVRPDFWMLDLENPQSWQKLLDFDRPGWWDSSSVVIHERTMLIFGGHDSSQVNEFNDPMGGYASKEDALLVRVDREGVAVAASYCGEEPGREACYGSLVTLPGSRVLCCCADATGDEMQAFELCHGDGD